MKYLILFLASLCLVLTGCSANVGMSRFHSPPIMSHEATTVNDSTIKGILERKAQLPPKFRMAVYFKKNRQEWSPDVSDHRNWSKEDQAIIMEAASTWEDQGIASDIFLLSDALVENDNLIGLRRAAAIHGADALMIVQGVYDWDTDPNWMATSYLLALPTLIVPGTDTRCDYLANAAIWDVRNEFLYASIEEQGSKEMRHPALIKKGEKTLIFARHEAAQRIADQMVNAEFNEDFSQYSVNEY